MSPWGVCASRRNPGEGHKRGDSRLSERFGKSLSPGPENTLAGGGGPAGLGLLLQCPFLSLQPSAVDPAPSPTHPTPTNTSMLGPYHLPPDPGKFFVLPGLLPCASCFLIHKMGRVILFPFPSTHFSSSFLGGQEQGLWNQADLGWNFSFATFHLYK